MESAETLLASHTGGTGIYAVDSLHWIGVHFHQAFPETPISWKGTKARLFLGRTAGSGNEYVRLFNADANGKPTGAALAEAVIDVSTLTTGGGWVDCVFGTAAAGLSPTGSFCLAVERPSGSGGFAGHDAGSSDGNCFELTSSTGGATWVAVASRALRFELYGTYET